MNNWIAPSYNNFGGVKEILFDMYSYYAIQT